MHLSWLRPRATEGQKRPIKGLTWGISGGRSSKMALPEGGFNASKAVLLLALLALAKVRGDQQMISAPFCSESVRPKERPCNRITSSSCDSTQSDIE